MYIYIYIYIYINKNLVLHIGFQVSKTLLSLITVYKKRKKYLKWLNLC